jgi:pycsar effector protein
MKVGRFSRGLRTRRRPFAPDIPEPSPYAPIESAEAWRAVGLVNEWVKHAEAKAATTLAAAGIVTGVLYNLVKGQHEIGLVLGIAAPVCGLLAVAAAVCAVVALWPRLGSRESPTSALYFDHIARRYLKAPTEYVTELKRLIASPDELLEQLCQYVWANAHVAHHKYRWAGRGLVALLGAAICLGLIALVIAVKSTGIG